MGPDDEQYRSPILSFGGGATILAAADPPIVAPDDGEISPEEVWDAQIDMEAIHWYPLGVPSGDLTFNLPSVTRLTPDQGQVLDDGAPAPALAWVTGCAAIDPQPYSQEGLAESTFLYQWGETETTTWDRKNADTTVTFAYDESATEEITSIVPDATESVPSRYQHEFDYNSVFISRVTYVSPRLLLLVQICQWITLGVGALALVGAVRIVLKKKTKQTGSTAGT